MIVFKVDHFVKLSDFSRALTDYYYSKSSDFDQALTRRQAVRILKEQLFFHGLNGEYGDGFFEASFEAGNEYNAIYEKCFEWVKKNYPHLIRS